ncbi:MAG: YraN family protein [Raoultibacter sp.]
MSTTIAAENKTLAERGVNAGARFIERRGFKILETEWSCSEGSIDIVAEDDNDLVFIEVKTRKSSGEGFPVEVDTDDKRVRLEKIAAHYLANYENLDCSVRFDVISILVIDEHKAFLRHHTNAFIG